MGGDQSAGTHALVSQLPHMYSSLNWSASYASAYCNSAVTVALAGRAFNNLSVSTAALPSSDYIITLTLPRLNQATSGRSNGDHKQPQSTTYAQSILTKANSTTPADLPQQREQCISPQQREQCASPQQREQRISQLQREQGVEAEHRDCERLL